MTVRTLPATDVVESLVDSIIARLPEARKILLDQPGHRYGDFIAFLDIFGFPGSEEKLLIVATALDAVERPEQARQRLGDPRVFIGRTLDIQALPTQAAQEAVDASVRRMLDNATLIDPDRGRP